MLEAVHRRVVVVDVVREEAVIPFLVGQGHEGHHEDQGQRGVETGLSEAEPGHDAGDGDVGLPVVEEVDAGRQPPKEVGRGHGASQQREAAHMHLALREPPGDQQHADEIVHDREGQEELRRGVVTAEDQTSTQPCEGDVRGGGNDGPVDHVQGREEQEHAGRNQHAAQGGAHGEDGLRPVQVTLLQEDGLAELCSRDAEEEGHEDVVDQEVHADGVVHAWDVEELGLHEVVVGLIVDMCPELSNEHAEDKECCDLPQHYKGVFAVDAELVRELGDEAQGRDQDQ